MRSTALALAVVAAVTAAATASASAPTGEPPRLGFSAPLRLPGAAGGTEPQVTTAPDGARYLITGANTTDSSKSSLLIYRSPAGSNKWTPTPGQMVGTRVPGPDVDVVVASTGRIVALEEDSAALSLVINYSDDRGRTWNQSSGLEQLADQDRPWLAAGPHGLVYLLFHNGFSSNATHNMYVATSTDGGASFGAPVPITLPGTAAWADLQCADSGGPSALLANKRTGRLYAIWGTRHGPLGGCGVQPPTPFTLVPANRIWVATSADAAAGSWSTSLAVDDSKRWSVVGMQCVAGVDHAAARFPRRQRRGHRCRPCRPARTTLVGADDHCSSPPAGPSARSARGGFTWTAGSALPDGEWPAPTVVASGRRRHHWWADSNADRAYLAVSDPAGLQGNRDGDGRQRLRPEHESGRDG